MSEMMYVLAASYDDIAATRALSSSTVRTWRTRVATSLSGARKKAQTTTSVSPEAFAARIRSARAEESASPDRA
jgi:hypothetical protein